MNDELKLKPCSYCGSTDVGDYMVDVKLENGKYVYVYYV